MADDRHRQLVDNVLRTMRAAQTAKGKMAKESQELSVPPSRRDFGFAMLGLSIFTLALAILLPPGNGLMFGFFALVLLFIAVWEIDRPQREFRKRRRYGEGARR